ncbi:MAG: hypothetical protein KDC54_00390 [Lewinella sp.]|nr:hypothetical protein [Lewinella sp.]
MKTVCYAAAMAALFLLSIPNQAMADTGSPGTLLVKSSVTDQDQVIRLQLANLQGEKTVVSLTNLDGDAYFTNVVRDHNGYLVKLNMKQAEEGRYVLRVTQGDETYSQIVYYRQGEIVLSQVAES